MHSQSTKAMQDSGWMGRSLAFEGSLKNLQGRFLKGEEQFLAHEQKESG